MSIRVMVVDDSLFMRTLISDILNADREIEVIDTARDGIEAVRKIPRIKPDCITLDLVMPGQDGLTALKHIMSEYPTPVIILSAHSKQDADITIKCLNAGAVGFVLKPSGEISLDIEKIKVQLLDEVKAASKVNIGRIKSLVSQKPKRRRRKFIGLNKIIVIGASTGGPQTLGTILSSLPTDFPVPIIVVQHMPTRFFTESLAEYLNKMSELTIKVAEHNEVLQGGRVYLAPSGFQLTVEPLGTTHHAPHNTEAMTRLTPEEPNALSPSIDLTMKSMAEIYKGNAIGIILTGMGHDGQEGMKAIKESGGKTIAQDDSSLIFGMPKAVIDAGCADKILPANEITEMMVECVS